MDKINPKMVTDKEEIKRITLKYCIDLLTNRPPAEEYRLEFESKIKLHKSRMSEDSDDKVLSPEMFDKALEALRKKDGKKYDFLLKSGSSYKNALFSLYTAVWEKERIPENWRKTTIIQLYKGKGDQSDLNNIRNIHLKDYVPKVFGHLLMNEVKVKIMENMSKFQLGAKAGHRAQEHIYVLKSIIAFKLMYNEGIILNLYYISKLKNHLIFISEPVT